MYLAFLVFVWLQACAAIDNRSFPAETPNKILYLSFFDKEDQIRIVASIGKQRSEQKVDRKVLWPKISCAYDLMETLELEEAEFDCPLPELAETILAPFSDLINLADEIVIVLPLTMLETPVDLLEHQQQPLFIQKPVSYQISKPLLTDAKTIPFPSTALIISDKTADPQRAALSVADEITRPSYFDIKVANRELLDTSGDVDLLLMSVHGLISDTADDNLAFQAGPVRAHDFLSIKTPMVYFDSCRLGVSSRFIRTFQSIGSQYYIAPILSNEAGVSSTQTMKMFFGHLSKGERPEIALFKTRQALWEMYKNTGKSIRVWRSYPFRIYRLN